MSEHTHHHGILAGLSATTAAVLTGGALIWASWHAISRTVASAMVVAVVAFMVVVIAGLAVAVAYAALWLRHKHAELRPLPVAAVSETPLQIAPASSVPHVILHLPEGISAEAAAALTAGLSRLELPPGG